MQTELNRPSISHWLKVIAQSTNYLNNTHNSYTASPLGGSRNIPTSPHFRSPTVLLIGTHLDQAKNNIEALDEKFSQLRRQYPNIKASFHVGPRTHKGLLLFLLLLLLLLWLRWHSCFLF